MIRSQAECQDLFYQKVCADNRISPTHISLYFALVHEAGLLFGIPFFLRRSVVAQLSKIYSPVTMNRCLKELHDYRYIGYRPSFKPRETMVEMLILDREENI